jgi:hypothetical protein
MRIPAFRNLEGSSKSSRGASTRRGPIATGSAEFLMNSSDSAA